MLRDFARPRTRRDEEYESRFDRRTIVYDSWISDGRLNLLCPRLLNLWPEVKASLNPHRRIYLRYEHLVLPSSAHSVLKFGGLEFDLRPGEDLSYFFAGQRVLMAISRNNPLDWIVDWATFHTRAQGATAVLLFDNGSSDYPLGAIVEALATVSGIARALVVSAPYPYGPAHGKTKKLEVPGRFLQTAMFNLARLRMLQRAASVLSLDIDEMLIPLGHRTIFEHVEQSWFGVKRLKGNWIYCARPGPAKAQREHVHRGSPPEQCSPKWALAPTKLAGRMNWTVHRIFGDFDDLFVAHDHRMMHCQQCSTGWKMPRVGTEATAPDPSLSEVWKRYLG